MKKGDFRDLEVWKKVREFRNDMFELTKSFPVEEKYRLTDQLIRASRSIPANIAEGRGRFHHQENIQFCRVTRGSLSECLEHLTCAFDCKYIDNELFTKHEKNIDKLGKLLSGYINYLKKMKNGG